MTQLHTMPLKVEALLSSRRFRGMALDERGAYLTLLCEAWLSGGQLPVDEVDDVLPYDDELQRERIRYRVVDRMFDRVQAEDGTECIANSKQRRVMDEVIIRHRRRVDAGKLGAEARWQCHTNAIAPAKQCHLNANGNQSQSKSQNQEEGSTPLTHALTRKAPPAAGETSRIIPSPEEWYEYGKDINCAIPWNEDQAKAAWNKLAAIGWVDYRGLPIKSWRAYLQSEADYIKGKLRGTSSGELFA